MPASQNKRRAATALTALLAPTLALTTLAAPEASAAQRVAGLPSGHAVVALRGATAVSVPGVTVDAVLSAIHSELVHGSAAALLRPEIVDRPKSQVLDVEA